MAVTPLYKTVEQHLRDRMTSGELGPGDLIPSEPQLAKLLDVSSGTVKRAIENLVKERLLYRHQGKGTYVSRIDFNNSLFRFFSYGTHEGRPIRIHKTTPARGIHPCPVRVARQLHIEPGTDTVYLERVGYEGDTPILIERCWWIADLVRGLEKEEVHIPDLLYAAVVEKFGVPVVRAEETLTAEAADEKNAETLAVAKGSPLVVLRRLTYTSGDQPIEFRVTRGRADRFSYKTEIR